MVTKTTESETIDKGRLCIKSVSSHQEGLIIITSWDVVSIELNNKYKEPQVYIIIDTVCYY